MRSEHQQINHLLAEMRTALERADGAAYLGQSETLLMLMRQHNMKGREHPLSHGRSGPRRRVGHAGGTHGADPGLTRAEPTKQP
jgi:hypothetical protein